MSAKAKPRKKTHEELLQIASTAVHHEASIFMVPSSRGNGKYWFVDIEKRTCRDGDGNGCPGRYYHGTCSHLEACDLIVELMAKWKPLIPVGG